MYFENITTVLNLGQQVCLIIPLLFIPLFYQWFTKDGKSKGVLNFFSFGAIIIGVNMLLFLPFLSSNLLDNYLSSVGLWFQNNYLEKSNRHLLLR